MQLRQAVNHYLDQLSNNRLRLIADFLKSLVHTEHQEQILAPECLDFRPPAGDCLLSHTKTWAGDDFEECLETVYETLSQL